MFVRWPTQLCSFAGAFVPNGNAKLQQVFNISNNLSKNVIYLNLLYILKHFFTITH